MATKGIYNQYTEAEANKVFGFLSRATNVKFPPNGTKWVDSRKSLNKIYVYPGLIDEANDFIRDENNEIIYGELYPLITEDEFIEYITQLGGAALTTLQDWQSDTSADSPYIIAGKDIPYRDKND